MNKELLEKIENLIVKQALQHRYAGFMFNYGDADEKIYSDTQDRNHSESRGSQDGRFTRVPGSQGKGKFHTEGCGSQEKKTYSEYCEGFLYKEHNDTSFD